eukprot:scaffold5728_cov72-Phaeocystis_antarctica.AAC.3
MLSCLRGEQVDEICGCVCTRSDALAGVDEAPLRLVAQAPLGWARVDVAPVRRWLLSGAMAAPDVEGERGCVGSIDEEVSRRGHWQRTPDTGHGHSLHCNRRRMYGTLATG